MAYIDFQQRVSTAQAISTVGNNFSTDVIDLLSDRDIGVGEPMAFVINFNVALAGTTPTFKASIQTDDNSGFSSAATLIEGQSLSAAAAGTQLVIPVPDTNERYIRLNYVLGGTTPTATVTADLRPMSMIQNARVYPDGFTIS